MSYAEPLMTSCRRPSANSLLGQVVMVPKLEEMGGGCAIRLRELLQQHRVMKYTKWLMHVTWVMQGARCDMIMQRSCRACIKSDTSFSFSEYENNQSYWRRFTQTYKIMDRQSFTGPRLYDRSCEHLPGQQSKSLACNKRSSAEIVDP